MKSGFGRFLILLCTLAPVVSIAQLNNEPLSDKISFNPQDSGTWGFGFSNFNYLRNTEYFNDIESGRTLFGYQLNPSLFIQPSRIMKLQGGIFVRHDFGGDNPYTQVLPTFSVKLQKNNFAATFGTLEGALSHRIIEPMFDINSAIERRVENGFDVRYTGNKPEGREQITPEKATFYNVWLNWEKFIQRGSPYKEAFTAGINLSPGQLSNITRVYPVAQLMATHHGGQIDADTTPMTMQINAALGLRLPVSVNNRNTSVADVYYLTYTENTSSGLFPYRNGNAWYANIQHRIGPADENSGFTVMLSYFNGNRFIAPRGTPIYQSVSTDKPGLTENNRELLFLRFMYSRQLAQNLSINARVEPVYDVPSKLFDYSYSLYIVYRFNKSFAL